MAASISLLKKVGDFLRIEGFDDNDVVKPLVLAAKRHLLNAGVAEPEADSDAEIDEGELALYELAVCIYVSTVYSGGESKLEPAMTSIILQIRDYTGSDA